MKGETLFKNNMKKKKKASPIVSTPQVTINVETSIGDVVG